MSLGGAYMLKIFKLAPKETFGSNCYLIENDGEWAVIDPSVQYSVALQAHPEIAGKVKYILLTHAHFDHMLGINSWASEVGYVGVGRDDVSSLSDPYKNCYLGFLGVHDGYFGDAIALSDGDQLPLGRMSIDVIATPGHTVGGITFRVGDSLFVGDTLFEGGGYGRCDLPGGDISVLEKSLISLFSEFRYERFYPGHGNSSTFIETLKYFE